LRNSFRPSLRHNLHTDSRYLAKNTSLILDQFTVINYQLPPINDH
jgi:hypothetical protein